MSLWNITGKASEPWTCEISPTALLSPFTAEADGGENSWEGVCWPGNTDSRSGRSCITPERLIKPGSSGAFFVRDASRNEPWMMTSPPFFFPPLRCFSANKQRSIAHFWFIYFLDSFLINEDVYRSLLSLLPPVPQFTHKERVDRCVFQRRYPGILFSALRLGKH